MFLRPIISQKKKKNDIYSTPHGCRKYPRRQAWEETGILSTNGKHCGSTSINQLKVKDLLGAQMVLRGQPSRDTARDCAKLAATCGVKRWRVWRALPISTDSMRCKIFCFFFSLPNRNRSKEKEEWANDRYSNCFHVVRLFVGENTFEEPGQTFLGCVIL